MRLLENDTIYINSVKELSVEEASLFKEQGYKKVRIETDSHPNKDEYDGKHPIADYYLKKPYDINMYIAVRDKLDKLIENISLEEPEEKKFATIYDRICKNITYDTPAAYPKTKREREYAKEQTTNSRNLINALLYGKCVCGGFACTLQSAIQLLEIDACYILRTYSTKKKGRRISFMDKS